MTIEEIEARTEQDSWFRRNFDICFNWFRDKPFSWVVTLSYNWRYVTIAFSAGLVMVLAVGLLRSGQVEFVFFPSPESENTKPAGLLMSVLNSFSPACHALPVNPALAA